MKNKSIYAIIFLFILVFGVNFNVAAFGETQVESFENNLVNAEKLIYQGEFHNADKRGKGTASVYKKTDGTRVLRLTNFSTTSGPDLFVYIYKTNDAKNSKSLKNVEYVSLGRLKSRRGTQEYRIPADVDLNSFRAISIWCKKFGVNFATAPLSGV